MFGKLMNRYYFGKSGQGDFTPDDLPSNRWQLFWDNLRTRFSQLVRLNLMHVLIWVPTIFLLVYLVVGVMNQVNQMDRGDGTSYQTQMVDEYQAEVAAGTISADAPAASYYKEKLPVLSAKQVGDNLQGFLMITLLLLVPAIAITGPITAGVCYVTQHWSRSEHAFIWSDFKDAVKENWKQSLVISLITGFMPIIVYMAWRFYGQLAVEQPFMTIPQVLVAAIGALWAISVTYMYPLIVTYKLRMKDVLRNGVLLAIARLPMSVGIRLLHCVPLALSAVGMLFINVEYTLLFLSAYYILLGFALSRFVTSSYTNAVFDRYINPRIEGAVVGKGLRAADDDEEDEEEAEEETAGKEAE